MNFLQSKTVIKQVVLFLLLSNVPHFAFSQQVDSIKTRHYVSTAITATNNGISLLPNFSLGKPAAIFDLSIGNGKFSFDPQFRFSLEGKPWSFIFWGRYKLANNDHFKMSIGAHPSVVFKTLTLSNNGISKDYITIQRYLATETTPTYYFNKNISMGVHYLYSYGLGDNTTLNTHFLALKAGFSNLQLPNKFRLSINPQIYYLKMDALTGTYLSATTTLSKQNIPFSISSIVSQVIKTDIAGKEFVWNVSLIYAFNKKYIRI
jgi:hypothetical protein